MTIDLAALSDLPPVCYRLFTGERAPKNEETLYRFVNSRGHVLWFVPIEPPKKDNELSSVV